MQRRTLGWGIIGASTIAREWMIGAIDSQPDSRVVGLYSRQAARGEQFARDMGIDYVAGSLDELLARDDIDIVYVGTTNEAHAEATIRAARAGKHVLCEKPLALTMADALDMVAACTSSGVVLGTNHHLRHAVTHRTLRALIAEGAIGQVLAARVFHAVFLPPHLMGWRVTAEDGGGVIMDITVHDTDTLRFILGIDVVEVTALAAQQGMGQGAIEDAVMGAMRFSNGVLAQFHDAFTIRHASTGIEVHGTEGSLIGVDCMTQQPTGTVYLRRAGQQDIVPLGYQNNLYHRSVHLFNQAVLGEATPDAAGATAHDGLCSLAVALAVRAAVQSGTVQRPAYPSIA